MSKLSELLSEFEKSKTKYDEFLTRAYEAKRDNRLSEDEVRLTARNSLRGAGFRDPEVIRLALKVLIADVEE